ncbi:MAG TPA: 1,2-phenylacetyl-CoA epoxidase subunit PaaC [Acidimicrobiales bacterium]|nr:1,2-phenylacetyl-CoA epoxidase subunit PaaC [Acidimicrobiales bacterium]|tara:strand:- start:2135 stop:2887 length:753 start_codon:yes stop_codon:yes gene_type:complete
MMVKSTLTSPIKEYLLAFADDEHLMGQQHTEWIGIAPFLEEDMAFASIGQDELGHASMLYSLVLGDSSEIDGFVFNRKPEEWRSCQLVESNHREWEEALMRHWCYDMAEDLRWELFRKSSHPELVSISERALKEEAYHRRHAEALVENLLSVPSSKSRLMEALEKIIPEVLDLFSPMPGEEDAISSEVVSGKYCDMFPVWRTRLENRFGVLDPDLFTGIDDVTRTRRHSDFDVLFNRIREVFLLDPEATW